VHNVAFGWLTAKSSFVRRLKYNESLDIGEDGELSSRILRHGFNLTHWDLVMGMTFKGQKDLCSQKRTWCGP
jgi:hypothetical protein